VPSHDKHPVGIQDRQRIIDEWRIGTASELMLLDLAMLVMPGGQERNQEEYSALVGRAGFAFRQVVPTHSAVSLIEAVPIVGQA